MTSNTSPFTLIVAAVTVGVAVGACSGGERTSRKVAAPGDTANKATGGPVETVEYEWADPNTQSIVEWRGDTMVLDPGKRPKRFRQSFEIEPERLRSAIEGFGLPEAWFKVRRYTDAADLRRQQADLERALRGRGVLFDTSSGATSVDWAWVVEQGKADLQTPARQLEALGHRSGYLAEREMMGLFASLIQSFQYAKPPETRVGAAGGRILTLGVSVPLEAMRNGWGDCDSRSLLLAAMLAASGRRNLIFLEGDRHLFVGLRIPPRPYDHVARVRGIPYVLLEMTASWPLGRVPERSRNGLSKGLYRIVPLAPEG